MTDSRDFFEEKSKNFSKLQLLSLPEGVLGIQLSFLTPKEVAQFCLVSTAWNKRALAPHYWRGMLIKIGLDHTVLDEAINKAQSKLNYKRLYAAFRWLPNIDRFKVNKLWELYCLSGQKELIKELIDRNIITNVNDTYNQVGAMPLHYAALSGSVEALKYVITTLGADKLARDNFGRSIVHYAALSHSNTVWGYTVNTLKMDPSAKDNEGQMASHYRDLVPVSSEQVLVRNGNMGKEAWEEIIRRGCVKSLKCILETQQTMEVLLPSRRFSFFGSLKAMKSLFLLVGTTGSVEMIEAIKYLLEHPQIKEKSVRRSILCSLLQGVLRSGSVAALKHVLEISKIREYAIEKPLIQGIHIMCWVARSGSVAAFEYVSSIPEIYDSLPREDKKEALFYAARSGSVPMLKYLLEGRGMDPFVQSNNGDNVFDIATSGNSIEAVLYLHSLNCGLFPARGWRLKHPNLEMRRILKLVYNDLYPEERRGSQILDSMLIGAVVFFIVTIILVLTHMVVPTAGFGWFMTFAGMLGGLLTGLIASCVRNRRIGFFEPSPDRFGSYRSSFPSVPRIEEVASPRPA
jgi:ankyrin repeat protein